MAETGTRGRRKFGISTDQKTETTKICEQAMNIFRLFPPKTKTKETTNKRIPKLKKQIFELGNSSIKVNENIEKEIPSMAKKEMYPLNNKAILDEKASTLKNSK